MHAVVPLGLVSVVFAGWILTTGVACAGHSRPITGTREPQGIDAAIMDAGPEDHQAFADAQDREPRAAATDAAIEDALGSAPPPEPIAPLHPERWFEASKSPARPIKLPAHRCIRDVGGCPFRPADLPPCPPDQRSLNIEGAAQLDRLVGIDVVLRGVLRSVETATHDHPPQICTQKMPARDLRLSKPAGQAGEAWESSVVLSDPRYPHAFGCASDEFSRCCGLPLMVPVLVAGRLSRPTQDFSSEFYEMVKPRICRLPDGR